MSEWHPFSVLLPFYTFCPSSNASCFCLPGPYRAVLDELRLLWESKLQKTGVLDPEPVPAL